MNMRNGNFHIISIMLGQTMRKEDMIRMIESGEELPDHYQEEFDNIIFCTIKPKEKKHGKIHFRLSRQVFTSSGRSQRVGISRLHDNRRTVKSNNRIRISQEIHRSSIRKK